MKYILSLLLLIFSFEFGFAQALTKTCYTTNGANCVPAVAASKSAKIDVSTGTTTEIVALVALKSIYVTSFNIDAGGTGTIKFVYGTGVACGTGTTDLTGAYALTATTNALSSGSGVGAILFVPVGNALCVTTNAAVQMSGSVSYAQF